MNPFGRVEKRPAAPAYLALATIVATCLVSTPTAAQARTETLAIGAGNQVSIRVPDGWTYEGGRDQDGIPAVRMADAEGAIALNVTFVPDPENSLEARELQLIALRELAASYVDSSVEKEIRAEPLEPIRGTGVYCMFTDARLVGTTELPDGEYRHVSVGVKTSAGWFAVFHLFSQDTKSLAHVRAMNLLKTSFTPSTAPRAPRDPRVV